jgi:tetratricopeptide (TPR) repeat protein
MNQEERFDQIEAYLFDQMSEEQRQAFEASIAQDRELAAEVEVHRLEHEVMQALTVDELRGKMQHWEQEVDDEAIIASLANASTTLSANTDTTATPTATPVRKLNWRRLATVAAVFLIMLIVGQRLIHNQYGNQAIIGETDLYGNEFVTRGDQGPLNRTTYELAIEQSGKAYKLEDYPVAIQSMQKALSVATSIIEKQEAEWKLALIYLSAGEDEKAKKTLQTIIETTDHDFAPDAQIALSKLNNKWRKFAW